MNQCVAVVLLAFFSPLALLADGCFVFKWNKSIDINEPTQKAIIVYDAGREDLLLQVKYEGPLEEFGWLIPVPSLPKVERGSMEPFYELSQLTQRHFGTTKGFATLSANGAGRGEEKVKVIEIKTVGAYEVAVLSATDTGSLAKWLQTHDYSLPEGKSDIIDDYIHRGWYFIAAKIDLKKDVGFETVSDTNPEHSTTKFRETIKSQLSSGELHPLLISFDSPECVFPLKISAVTGKPSEVSLYILSDEPLLNRAVFDKACAKLVQRQAEWETQKPQREMARRRSMQNLRTMSLAFQMYSISATNEPVGQARPKPDWSLEDLEAISNERRPQASEEFDDDFYASPYELLECMAVPPDKMPECRKQFPRLEGKHGYLTKQVSTFRPEEMSDLKFEPAIPVLAQLLPRTEGKVAAGVLTQCGRSAVPVLVSACQSTNATARINTSSALQSIQNQCLIEPLLVLLHDDLPQVRLNAVMAVMGNWTPQFIDPLIALFRDSEHRVRTQAANWLCIKEPPEHAPKYLDLLKSSDPHVQSCALRVLLRINPNAVSRTDLLRSFSSPQLDAISMALSVLQRHETIPGQPWQPGIRSQQVLKSQITSAEAAPLTTNSLTMARLIGLKILRLNGDADAVELTLPLLQDTNSIVRSRAFTLIRTITNQNISDNDPAKWDQWWAENKIGFKPSAGR